MYTRIVSPDDRVNYAALLVIVQYTPVTFSLTKIDFTLIYCSALSVNGNWLINSKLRSHMRIVDSFVIDNPLQ